MIFSLLAVDYDGTIARDGTVDEPTLSALERVRGSGRRIVLATGRHLPDLCSVFPELEVFDRVVAENGGVLYRPETRSEKLLCDPPNARLIALLQEKNVPFSVGKAVIATWQPNDQAVLSAIRELGLDLQVIFNKSAVMVLPSGVNKGTGTQAALDDLGISAHNMVAIGDAENDLPFLRIAGCSIAVANALPSVKEQADVAAEHPRGQGVIEIVSGLLSNDLADFDSRMRRGRIEFGRDLTNEGPPVTASSRRGSILIAGPSGSGKSTLVDGILEQFIQHRYQFCLIDPEGDYDGFTGALSFGSAKERPDTKTIFRALDQPSQSVVVDLLAVSMEDRPTFFASLLPRLQELRARTGRPHWLVIDEVHHMLPEGWQPHDITIPQALDATLLVTVHPEHVSKAVLNLVDTIVAIGKPNAVFGSFSKALEIPTPTIADESLPSGEAVIWLRKSAQHPQRLRTVRSSRDKLRHVRNYAEGELSEGQSFYFRGRESKLNLRAQNLTTFLQLADGVDDDTWLYHLHKSDYSKWFRSIIKDEELGSKAEQVEHNQMLSARESRKEIRDVVESRYTAPA